MPMDGGSLLVADAGAPVDSDDQAWEPWVPSGPTGVPVISTATVSATATVPATSPVPATLPAPATAPIPATAPVPATSPVPPTSVSMASSSAGLIDPSMTWAIAQPMAAATVAQPMAYRKSSMRRDQFAYGLCQCLEVGGSLRPTVSTGTAVSILKLIDGTESGAHYGPSLGAGERYLGFNAGRVCAAESNARGFGGTPHNTLATVDTGPSRWRAQLHEDADWSSGGAKSQSDSTRLSPYRGSGEEQIPGPPQVGGIYSSAGRVSSPRKNEERRD